MKIYAAAPNGHKSTDYTKYNEVWEIYRDKAIADIQGFMNISRSDAKAILKTATADNPIVLPDVEYWTE